MRTRHLPVVTFVLLALAAASSAGPLRAQGVPNTPLFLAIPETFPVADARALVVREPNREVIVLRADEATPEALGMALGLLRRVRQRPLEPGRGFMVPVTGFAVTAAPRGPRRERLERALAQLAEQPLTQLGRLGLGRSLRFSEPDR
jgi:hypothetical protein